MQRVWKKCKEKLLNNVHWEKTNITSRCHIMNKSQTGVVLTVLIELELNYSEGIGFRCLSVGPGTWMASNEERQISVWCIYILKPVCSHWHFNHQTDVVIIFFITVQRADHSYYDVIIVGLLYNITFAPALQSVIMLQLSVRCVWGIIESCRW